jgi:acyl-CoA thioesterase
MDIKQIIERFKADRYAMELTGIDILDVREDYAKTKLAVESKHMNALGIIHGGVLFTLADFTFAVATNGDRQESTVAIECHISFLKPVTGGTLYAEALLISKSRSLGSYDVLITNDRNELVAKFHGRGFVRRENRSAD